MCGLLIFVLVLCSTHFTYILHSTLMLFNCLFRIVIFLSSRWKSTIYRVALFVFKFLWDMLISILPWKWLELLKYHHLSFVWPNFFYFFFFFFLPVPNVMCLVNENFCVSALYEHFHYTSECSHSIFACSSVSSDNFEMAHIRMENKTTLLFNMFYLCIWMDAHVFFFSSFPSST